MEIAATFYPALHLIDKRLKDPGKTVCNRRQRLAAVRRRLPKMHDPSNELYAMGVSARYSGIGAVHANLARCPAQYMKN